MALGFYLAKVVFAHTKFQVEINYHLLMSKNWKSLLPSDVDIEEHFVLKCFVFYDAESLSFV